MPIVPFSLGGELPSACRGGAVTFGNFDGVHRGHLALLAETVRQARALSTVALAVTFQPHPFQVLRPDVFQPLLTTVPQRAQVLLEQGADHVVVLATTHHLLDLSPAAFFQQVILEQFEARALIEGYNFGFGKNRAGNVDTLKELARPAGIDVTLVPPLEIEGKPVSSSRVRKELEAGHVALATELLGRPFRIAGTVVTGRKRGTSIGFPTANLDDIRTLIPADGVYAARVSVADRPYAAAVNIGPNPTFGENARKVEVHIIGYQGDLYGQSLEVDVLARLRDTRPFAGVDELKSQLQLDIATAREIERSQHRP